MVFYSCSYLHAAPRDNNHDFANLSCKVLMPGLIEESSFNEIFSDTDMELAFDYERFSNRYIMLKFVRTAGRTKGLIYGNLS